MSPPTPAPYAILTGSWTRDFALAVDDLLYLSSRWLVATPEAAGAADTKGDGKTNLSDFAILSAHWLMK